MFLDIGKSILEGKLPLVKITILGVWEKAKSVNMHTLLMGGSG